MKTPNFKFGLRPMFLLTDLRTKFDIARDRNRPGLTCPFAVMEMLCEPVSLFTVAGSVILAIRPGIKRINRVIGTKAIVEKLNVEGRVKSAVDAMDMADFHAMLNQIMAKHIGAIHVLGYLLGAIAGLNLVSRNSRLSL